MVYFVGAGPGAEDLITVRGAKLLREADCVIFAGSLVNKELLKECKKSCVFYDSSKMSLSEVCSIYENLQEKKIVRLHSGDPCLYGAIREQMDFLENKNILYESVPGVSSFCAAASSLNLEYTLPSISQSVIITRLEGRTEVPSKESLKNFASIGATMVIFLSTSLAVRVQEELIASGIPLDTPAAVVYKASWPQEKKWICTISSIHKTIQENNIKNSALIIVGNIITHNVYEKSKLYDENFSTGFRTGKK